MHRKSILKQFDEFFANLNWYTEFLNKILNAERVVSTKAEKEEVVEAFLLKLDVTWSILVKHVFFYCLASDTTKYSDLAAVQLPKKINGPLARVLLTGDGYSNFSSVGSLKGKAKNILVDKYNPFQSISSVCSEKISEFYSLRNLIAHHSLYQRQNVKKVYRKYGIQNNMQPGKFLISCNTNTKEPRLSIYINALNDAAWDMEDFIKKIV